MRKRVRKKLRLAEFQEFGVALRFRLDPALSQGGPSPPAPRSRI